MSPGTGMSAWKNALPASEQGQQIAYANGTPPTSPMCPPLRASASLPPPPFPDTPGGAATAHDIWAFGYYYEGQPAHPPGCRPPTSSHQSSISIPVASMLAALAQLGNRVMSAAGETLPSMAQILEALAELGDRVMRGEEVTPRSVTREEVALPNSSDEDVAWYDARSTPRDFTSEQTPPTRSSERCDE